MRRTVLALLVASTLAAPQAVQPLWGFFLSVWSVATAEEGIGWDPDGRSLAAPLPQPTPNAGIGMDPSGQPTADVGGLFDPDGLR